MSDSSKNGKTKRRVVVVSSPSDNDAMMKSSPDTRKVEDGQLVLLVDPSETLTSDDHSDAAVDMEAESLDIKPPQSHASSHMPRKEKHKKRKKEVRRREKERVVHKERTIHDEKRDRYVKDVSSEGSSKHKKDSEHRKEWVARDSRQVVNKEKGDLREKLKGIKEKMESKTESKSGKSELRDKRDVKGDLKENEDKEDKKDEYEAREKKMQEKRTKIQVAIKETKDRETREAGEEEAKGEDERNREQERLERDNEEHMKAEVDLEQRNKESRERDEMIRDRQAAKEKKRRDLMERELLRDELKAETKDVKKWPCESNEGVGDSSDERHREEGRVSEKKRDEKKVKRTAVAATVEKADVREGTDERHYDMEKRKRVDTREKGRGERDEGRDRSRDGDRYIRGGYEYRKREHSVSPYRDRKKREESLKERERLERLERERQRERRVREERERIEREHRSRQQQEERKIVRERERREVDRDRERGSRDSRRDQRNGRRDPERTYRKVHSPDADDEVSEDDEEDEEAEAVEGERGKEKRKDRGAEKTGEKSEGEDEEAVSESEGEKSESVSPDSQSVSGGESGEAESDREEGDHKKEHEEMHEEEETEMINVAPTENVLKKSKFDEADDHMEVDVSDPRPVIDEDHYLPHTPPASPVELRDDLPVYYPAIQGCRSVEEFRCLNRIEEGTYGVVYRACDKKINEIVALKRLKMEKEKEGFPITSLREINTLLKAQHPNIVTVREIVVGSNMDKIYIVMDYVEHDMKALIESMKQPFLIGEVKTLMRQLLRAVAHLHDNWILHRDLKTSNLLLSHKGILKVGDFGLAREYGSPLKPYTPIVVTLWYRAPELLLGVKQYSTAIDMWSVGCIFAEFLTMKALWPGKSEIDELNRIFKDLGTPNEKIWPGVGQLPGMKKCTFAEYPYNTLRHKFGSHLTDLGFDLLNKFVRYNPVKRVSAEEALKHNYFSEAPQPVDPSMFPTWPAKSEMQRKQGGHSPKAPSGGKAYAKLMDDEDEKDLISASGFHMENATKGAAAGGLGFSLRF